MHFLTVLHQLCPLMRLSLSALNTMCNSSLQMRLISSITAHAGLNMANTERPKKKEWTFAV